MKDEKLTHGLPVPASSKNKRRLGLQPDLPRRSSLRGDSFPVAAEEGHQQVDRGANYAVEDNEGKTMLRWARIHEWADLAT